MVLAREWIGPAWALFLKVLLDAGPAFIKKNVINSGKNREGGGGGRGDKGEIQFDDGSHEFFTGVTRHHLINEFDEFPLPAL